MGSLFSGGTKRDGGTRSADQTTQAQGTDRGGGTRSADQTTQTQPIIVRHGGLNLGDEMPDFTANSTDGEINFHEWLGDSWAILFSHPADFTPVCTTELRRVMQLHDEFIKRGVKVIALSCDTVKDHNGWSQDILAYNKVSGQLPFPILEDSDRTLAKKLGMLDPVETDKSGIPLTCRAVFVIGPEKRLKLSILYPATTGRNFTEILRVIDSLQLTAQLQVATPVDWTQKDRCLILPKLSDDAARDLFPNMEIETLPSGRNYLRYTLQETALQEIRPTLTTDF